MGINGMNRRYADYQPELGFESWNIAATVGGYLVATSVLIMLFNFVFSFLYGKKAVPNPWNSLGLEWQITSPPPELNYSDLPEIVGEPYGYGKPGAIYGRVAPEDYAPNPTPEPPGISGPISPKQAPVPAGD
jgi:cytochrome c oxidase subunit 1